MTKPQLMVTLWPSFPHFPRFAADGRLAGIRLNSAMMAVPEIEKELDIIARTDVRVPLYFDAKGRQLRIKDVRWLENKRRIELVLNHPISVKTPTPVLFKAGEDHALLSWVCDGGTRLIIRAPNLPKSNLNPGESLHIRDPSLEVHGPIFTDEEKAKLAVVRAAGFTRYFLSYVESRRDIDEFRELVGADAELMLKIENQRGLRFVAEEFAKEPGLSLVAARGDLYVEVSQPHHILAATKLIIDKDPEACVGSRLLLSTVAGAVPSCADFSELAWLHDIGYRRMMLCDELCLKGELLAVAVNAFNAFRDSYY